MNDLKNLRYLVSLVLSIGSSSLYIMTYFGCGAGAHYACSSYVEFNT